MTIRTSDPSDKWTVPQYSVVVSILCARTYRRPKIFGTLAPVIAGVVTVSYPLPRKHAHPHVCFHTKFRRSRSNRMGVGGVPNIWGRWGPATLRWWVRLTDCKYASVWLFVLYVWSDKDNFVTLTLTDSHWR